MKNLAQIRIEDIKRQDVISAAKSAGVTVITVLGSNYKPGAESVTIYLIGKTRVAATFSGLVFEDEDQFGFENLCLGIEL